VTLGSKIEVRQDAIMSEATPEDLREYMSHFRLAFIQGARAQFNKGEQKQLGLLPYLRQYAVFGLVSTELGVGFEFRAEGGDSFQGTAEPMHQYLATAPLAARAPHYGLTLTPGTNVTMVHSEFDERSVLVDDGALLVVRSKLHERRIPIALRGSDAIAVVVESRIGGRHVHYAFLSGDNSKARWSRQVAVREADSALLRARVEMHVDQGRYAPFRRLADRSVLVLGDFADEGRMRLAEIKRVLGDAGYEPFQADEIEDIPRQDIRTKILTLATVCRFVVMDDSSRGGQIGEVPIVEQAKTPLVILRLEGSFSSMMTRGHSWGTVYQGEYTSSTLPARLTEGIAAAEHAISEIERTNNAAYRSWRGRPHDPAAADPYHVGYGLTPFTRQSAV